MFEMEMRSAAEQSLDACTQAVKIAEDLLKEKREQREVIENLRKLNDLKDQKISLLEIHIRDLERRLTFKGDFGFPKIF